MGADIKVRIPKGLDIQEFLKECRNVPIDAEINRPWIYFHYGYWSAGHCKRCSNFVKRFIKKHNVKAGKWSF